MDAIDSIFDAAVGQGRIHGACVLGRNVQGETFASGGGIVAQGSQALLMFAGHTA